MGFNNGGVHDAVERLKNRPEGLIVGGNIGKNKVTPNDNAVDDYLICFEALHPYVDYFTVNVSSPNTPNLRDLQNIDGLRSILIPLIDENKKRSNKPILLKISPDLDNSDILSIVDLIQELKIDGIITTNTTVSREKLKSDNISFGTLKTSFSTDLTWSNPTVFTPTLFLRNLSNSNSSVEPVSVFAAIFLINDVVVLKEKFLYFSERDLKSDKCLVARLKPFLIFLNES